MMGLLVILPLFYYKGHARGTFSIFSCRTKTHAATPHGGTIVDSTKLASSGRLKFTQSLIRPICSSYCKGYCIDRPVEKVDFLPCNTQYYCLTNQ